jgi:hypothetical protein
MLQRALLAVLLLLAPACRASRDSFQTPPFPPQDVEVSRPDVARIYVVREGQARGRAHLVHVEFMEQTIGALGPNDYLCWETPPGRHLLTFVYEGPHVDGGDLEGLYSLEAEPGRAYWLAVEIDRKADDPELRARAGHPEIVLLDPAEGRERVAAREPVAER